MNFGKRNLETMKMMISRLKKKIANINFGMLEKSNNTAQRSVIFNSLKEACHYQRKHGGRIYALEEETCIRKMVDLDEETDEEEEERRRR